MPTYDYRCRKCGHPFELFHSIKDETPKRCPKCKGRAQRVPSSGAGLLFKGSGFYITDYRSSAYKEKAKQDSPGGGSDKDPKKKSKTPAPPASGGSTSSGDA
jgi:putative FmdB family regulatory protein